MDKEQLIAEFDSAHTSFLNYIASLNESDFIESPDGKWSAGQQLMHIYLSIKPLEQVFVIPGFILKILFGKSKKGGRSYDEIVADYTKILQQGGKASSKYIPKKIVFDQKEKTISLLKKTVAVLIDKIGETKHKDLEEILLPHPLMGKLTLQEMLFFSIYHVQHHHRVAQENKI